MKSKWIRRVVLLALLLMLVPLGAGSVGERLRTRRSERFQARSIMACATTEKKTNNSPCRYLGCR